MIGIKSGSNSMYFTVSSCILFSKSLKKSSDPIKSENAINCLVLYGYISLEKSSGNLFILSTLFFSLNGVIKKFLLWWTAISISIARVILYLFGLRHV